MFSVLVVDDDDTIILFMSRLLKNKFECKVLRAENGLEALSILEDDPVDVVFMDITMPVMDGVETLQAIRNDSRFKDLPVIVLSAVADKNVVDKVVNMNVYSFMLKPLMYDSAYKAIKKLFEKLKEEQNRYSVFDEIQKDEDLNRPKILIVDSDNQFTTKFKDKLCTRFIIFETDSGAKGLNIFMKERPNYVFLAENLPLLSEEVIANKIKSFQKASSTAKNNSNHESLVYLMKNPLLVDDEETNSITDPFDEILFKTDKEGILLRGMNKALKF